MREDTVIKPQTHVIPHAVFWRRKKTDSVKQLINKELLTTLISFLLN